MAAALLMLPHNVSLQESMSLYSVSRLWQNKAVNETECGNRGGDVAFQSGLAVLC